MKKYLYILIIIFIFLCVCLFCKGCIDIYDGFSVGGQVSDGINISQNLILNASGFDCKSPSPSPTPSPPSSSDDAQKDCNISSNNYQLFNGECKKSCKNDYHSYNSSSSCNEAKDLYYIYREGDSNDNNNRICRKGPHTDSYTYINETSCNKVIYDLKEPYKSRTNASAICPKYNLDGPDSIFSVEDISCPKNGLNDDGTIKISTSYYFEKNKGYQPVFVKCDNTDDKSIPVYTEEKAKVSGSGQLRDIITQNEYYNNGNGDKYTNTSGTDIIKDLWYCDWENFCCKYNSEKGRLSLQECNSQCIPPDPNPNYSVPDKYENNTRANMNSNDIINYNTLKSLDKYKTTLLEGYLKSDSRPNYITNMINDKYPLDRIFVFNNYTNDSIAIIMTMPGKMGGASATGGKYGGDATQFIDDLKNLRTRLEPYSDNMILDGGIDNGKYISVNKIIVGVIEPKQNYKLKIPTFKDFGNGDDLKSSFPSVNLAFVKNEVDYIKYNYKQLVKDGTAKSQIKTDSFNNISGGSVIELTLNNSKQTGVTEGGENSGVPQFITDLPDYYDLSIIPPSSVGAHMNASTTAYNESIDIDLTDKTYKDNINIKCEDKARPKPNIPDMIPGTSLGKIEYCNENAHNTRWCDLNCSMTTETGPKVKPGKGKLPEYGNIYGVNVQKDIPGGNDGKTQLWGCGIPDSYSNMKYYKDINGPGYSVRNEFEPTCLEYYDGNKPDKYGKNIELTDKSSDSKCNRWSIDTVKRAYRDSFRCGLYTASDNSNINIFSPDSKAKYIGPNYNIKIEPYNDICNSPKLHIPYDNDLNDLNDITNRFSWDMSKLIKNNNYKDVNAYVYPYQDELGLSEHGQATAHCRVNLFQSSDDYFVYDLEKIIKNGSSISASNGKYVMNASTTTINSTVKKPVFLFSVYDLGENESGKITNNDFIDKTQEFTDFNASYNIDKYKGYINNCNHVEYKENINDIKYFSGSEDTCNNYINSYYCNLKTSEKGIGVPGKQVLDKLNETPPFIVSVADSDSDFVNSPCKELYSCSGSDPIPLKPEDKIKLCQADNQQECVNDTNCSWTNESYYYNTSGTCYIDYTKYMDINSSGLCGQYYNASLTDKVKLDGTLKYSDFLKIYAKPTKITTDNFQDAIFNRDYYGSIGQPHSNASNIYTDGLKLYCEDNKLKDPCNLSPEDYENPRCSKDNSPCKDSYMYPG